jgi:hypothetical protein
MTKMKETAEAKNSPAGRYIFTGCRADKRERINRSLFPGLSFPAEFTHQYFFNLSHLVEPEAGFPRIFQEAGGELLYLNGGEYLAELVENDIPVFSARSAEGERPDLPSQFILGQAFLMEQSAKDGFVLPSTAMNVLHEMGLHDAKSVFSIHWAFLHQMRCRTDNPLANDNVLLF